MNYINVIILYSNNPKAILTMSAFQYLSVNLFVRGVPSIMEQPDLAKVLEIYGEMNMKPEAFSVKFRRTHDPKRPYDDQRYDVVLYGFRVNTGTTACFGHMFSSIIQMKRQVRHAWIDSEGKPQYVFITENNRQIPQNFLDELLWSERKSPSTTNKETTEQAVTEQTVEELSDAEKYDRSINRMMSSTQWLKSKTVQSEEQRQADQAAQDAQHAYLVEWAGRKELSSLRQLH